MKKMTNREYVNQDGEMCPFCKLGTSIVVTPQDALQFPWCRLETSSLTFTLDLKCSECNKEWEEFYTLTKYKAL